MGSAPVGTALFVATDLDSFEVPADAPYADDVTVSGRAYRRLDPPYYAWLRSRMAAAKRARDARQIAPAEFDTVRTAFNAVHAWAVRTFGEAALVAAAKALDVAAYQPPRPDDDLPPCGARLTPRSPAPASGHVFPAAGTFAFTEPVTAAAVAKVDAIRAQAHALGWSEAALLQNRGNLRFPYGQEYGLVCHVADDVAIVAVSREAITLARPRGNPLRFPNPGIEQPWCRAPRDPALATPLGGTR